MNKEAAEELRVRFKLAVIEYAKDFGAREACKEFNVPRSTFYRWKKHYNTVRPHSSLGYRPPAPVTVVGQPSQIPQFSLTL